MRDSTLNTLAILIFGLTMASLLGPMLHLSPLVPALGTALLLGLATVDQWGLQGRVGHILTDWLALGSAPQRERVLHHEAGHLLTALLLDIPVQDYALTPWEAWRRGLPGQGGVVFDYEAIRHTLAAGTLPAQWVDYYCQVCMAGIAAEQLVYGNAQGGQDDRLSFQAFWQQLDRPMTEAPIKQRWATLQAKTLLERHQDTFEALVAAMAERQPLTDCRALVQQAQITV